MKTAVSYQIISVENPQQLEPMLPTLLAYMPLKQQSLQLQFLPNDVFHYPLILIQLAKIRHQAYTIL